jgi:hypothetical protein
MSYSQNIDIHPTPISPTLSYILPTAQVTNFNVSNNYMWSLNGSNIPNSNTQYQNIDNGTNYNSGWYQVQATNEFNCQATSNPLYILQPLFAFDSDQSCSGQPFQLINQSDLSDLTCQIYLGDGTSELFTQNPLAHTYNSVGDFTAAVNCYNALGEGYYTLPYSVFPTPAIPAINYNAPNVQCINCTSNTSLDWFEGNTVLSETSTLLNIVNNEITNNGPYSVTVTNGFGCQNHSDTLWVIVPHFALSNQSGCQGIEITATQLTEGMDWLTCSINWGDGFSESFNNTSLNHTYLNAFNGSIMVSCNYNNEMGMSTQNIQVFANPNPNLTETNNIIECLNCENGWTIHWTIDSVARPNFDNIPVVSADLGQWYYIQVVDNNGCSGVDSIQTDYIAPHVDEQDLGFDLYPSPANEKLYWLGSSNADQIDIYDSNGNWIWGKEKPNVNEVLNVSMYNTGLYTFVVSVGHQTKTARFMITH